MLYFPCVLVISDGFPIDLKSSFKKQLFFFGFTRLKFLGQFMIGFCLISD